MKLRRPRTTDSIVCRPGSILLFSGRGVVSRSIQIGTCSCLTHCGVCATVTAEAIRAENERREPLDRPPLVPNWPDWHDGLKFIESTTLGTRACILQGAPISGVQCHEIPTRIREFDGEVWVMHLRERLSRDESARLTAGLLEDVGTCYDYRGALLSATIWLKHGLRAARAADRHTLYCCEVGVNRLQKAFSTLRQYRPLEPGTLAPRDVVPWAEQLYYPMARIKARIKGKA